MLITEFRFDIRCLRESSLQAEATEFMKVLINMTGCEEMVIIKDKGILYGKTRKRKP